MWTGTSWALRQKSLEEAEETEEVEEEEEDVQAALCEVMALDYELRSYMLHVCSLFAPTGEVSI